MPETCHHGGSCYPGSQGHGRRRHGHRLGQNLAISQDDEGKEPMGDKAGGCQLAITQKLASLPRQLGQGDGQDSFLGAEGGWPGPYKGGFSAKLGKKQEVVTS